MWAKFCCQDLSEQPQTGCWSLAHHGYQLPSASAAGLRLPPWKHEGGREGSEVAVVWVRDTDPKAAAPFDVSLLRIRPHAAELPTLTSPSGPRGPCHAWQPAQRPGRTPTSPKTPWANSEPELRGSWGPDPDPTPEELRLPLPWLPSGTRFGHRRPDGARPPRSHPATCLRSSPASAAGRGFSSVPRSCN